MDPEYKKFILHNIILSLILATIGSILALSLLPQLIHPVVPLIFIFAPLVNILFFRLNLLKKKAQLNIMTAVTKSFGLKFFSYISLILIMILIEKDKSVIIVLVAVVFLVYILFTILEVKTFMDHVRNRL